MMSIIKFKQNVRIARHQLVTKIYNNGRAKKTMTYSRFLKWFQDALLKSADYNWNEIQYTVQDIMDAITYIKSKHPRAT